MARYPEEKDENGRTLYGGVKDGVLVGGTKVRHSLIWSQERGKFGFSGTFSLYHFVSLHQLRCIWAPISEASSPGWSALTPEEGSACKR